MKQPSLFPAPSLVHGGDLARGRRHERRPRDRKRPLHLTLKARRALGPHQRLVTSEAQRLGQKFGLRVYSQAVASDHVHLLLRLPSRRAYVGFIRSLTGLLARRLGPGLWRLLPFSRIAHWGRDFVRLKAYLRKNREEAAGLRPYEPRKDWYRARRKPAHLALPARPAVPSLQHSTPLQARQARATRPLACSH